MGLCKYCELETGWEEDGDHQIEEQCILALRDRLDEARKAVVELWHVRFPGYPISAETIACYGECQQEAEDMIKKRKQDGNLDKSDLGKG